MRESDGFWVFISYVLMFLKSALGYTKLQMKEVVNLHCGIADLA